MPEHPLILLGAFPIGAYLIGSIAFGPLIARVRGVDWQGRFAGPLEPPGATEALHVVPEDGQQAGRETRRSQTSSRHADRLGAAYPNPFNPRVDIPFEVAADDHVRISVFNMSGHLVAVLLDGARSPSSPGPAEYRAKEVREGARS